MPTLTIPAGAQPSDPSWIEDENGQPLTWQQVADLNGATVITNRADDDYGLI